MRRGRLETTTFPGGVITRTYDATTGKLTSLAGPDVTPDLGVRRPAPQGRRDDRPRRRHRRLATRQRLPCDRGARQRRPPRRLRLRRRRPCSRRLAASPSPGDPRDRLRHPKRPRDSSPKPGRTTTTARSRPTRPRSAASSRSRGATCGTTSAASSRRPRRRPPAPRVLVYEYDLAARLAAVYEDGLLVESYGFDDNGNRLSSLNADGVFDAAFDDQDRILECTATKCSRGPITANCWRRSTPRPGTPRPSRTMPWATSRGVGLPDGDLVEYLVDGRGRRVGKLVNGRLGEGPGCGGGQLQPVAGARRRGQRGREVCLRRRRQRAGADGGRRRPRTGSSPTTSAACGGVVDVATGRRRAGARVRRLGPGLAGHEPGPSAIWVCRWALRPGHGARAVWRAGLRRGDRAVDGEGSHQV
jgi:hypothetical protein